MNDIFPAVSLLNLLVTVIRPRLSLSNQELASPWVRSAFVSYWLSRSAWSLVLIVKWMQLCSEVNQQLNIWVPDYFCNQSLRGIKAAGVKIIFYPVTKELTPDWTCCKTIARKTPPHLFMLVHYFGKMNDINGAALFCRQYQAIFIEDCAHVLLPYGQVGSAGDFVMYSQHKLLAIPDGALLLARPTVMKRFNKDPSEFSSIFDLAYAQLPPATTAISKWLIKRLIHRICPALVRLLRRYRSEVENLNDTSEYFLNSAPHFSKFSRQLLAKELPRIEAYGWIRKKNAEMLRRYFPLETEECFEETSDEKAFPYMQGLYCTGFRTKTLLQQLKQNHVPVSTWPDLAPEVLQDRDMHLIANETQEQMIFFSVHQTLSIHKMLKACSYQLSGSRSTMADMRLRWDLIGEEWRELFLQAPRSSLLQSPLYINALCQTKNSWSPRFGGIEKSGKLVALFAVIEKHGPFGTKVARLNRGPVWLQDEVEESAFLIAMQLLRNEYSLKQGKFLFIAPNEPMQATTMDAMENLGFRNRKISPWTSILMDLRLDELDLRSKLDGKWRNQLAVSERSGLALECSKEQFDFELMLTQYKMTLIAKKFSGPSIHLLRCLWKQADLPAQPVYILKAMYQTRCVAGVMLVCHGTSATYLVGWNSDEGRKINAHNFLLWQSILLLKKAGYLYFDLGGVNEYLTPGITSFKRGLKGTEYRLLGEYVSWNASVKFKEVNEI